MRAGIAALDVGFFEGTPTAPITTTCTSRTGRSSSRRSRRTRPGASAARRDRGDISLLMRGAGGPADGRHRLRRLGRSWPAADAILHRSKAVATVGESVSFSAAAAAILRGCSSGWSGTSTATGPSSSKAARCQPHHGRTRSLDEDGRAACDRRGRRYHRDMRTLTAAQAPAPPPPPPPPPVCADTVAARRAAATAIAAADHRPHRAAGAAPDRRWLFRVSRGYGPRRCRAMARALSRTGSPLGGARGG